MQNNYQLFTINVVFAHFQIMKFHVKSQMTPMGTREAAEVTAVINRLFSMTGIVPFKLCFVGSLERAMSAVILVFFIFQSNRLECHG